MTRDEEIIKLAAEAKSAIERLSDAIKAAAPDEQKEALADRFNAISDQIAKLSGWDLPDA